MAESVQQFQDVDRQDVIALYAVEPFRMSCRSDASQVALRLRDLLAVEGVFVDIRRARSLAAEILGYRTWSALLSDLNGPVGLDDEIVDVEVVTRRRVLAYSALSPLVADSSVVGRVITALAPTSCERHGARTHRRYADLCAPDAYHPVRFCMLLDHVDLGEWDDRDEDEDDAIRRLVDRAEGLIASHTEFFPYDGYAVHERRIRPMARLARRVRDEPLRIVDAESQALALSVHPLPTSVPAGDRYVHLGRHRFPSPYPGLGIEGCYVTRDAAERLCLLPALSPPAETEVESCDPDDLPGYLLEHLRGHAMPLEAIIDGGGVVALDPSPGRESFGPFDPQGRAPYAEGLDGLWRPFMRPVAAAALNALAKTAASDGRSRIGVPEFCERRIVASYFKAKDEQRSEILMDLQASGALPIVTILGTTRTEAETGFFATDLPTALTFWPTRHAQEWLLALSDDGFERYARQEVDACLARFALRGLSRDPGLEQRQLDPARVAAIVREQARQFILREDGGAAAALCEEALRGPFPGDCDLQVLHVLALDLCQDVRGADDLGAVLLDRDARIGLWLKALRSGDLGRPDARRDFQIAWFHDPAMTAGVFEMAKLGPAEVGPEAHPGSVALALLALSPAVDRHCDVLRTGLMQLRSEPATSSVKH
jgi:hypothetical protein